MYTEQNLHVNSPFTDQGLKVARDSEQIKIRGFNPAVLTFQPDLSENRNPALLDLANKVLQPGTPVHKKRRNGTAMLLNYIPLHPERESSVTKKRILYVMRKYSSYSQWLHRDSTIQGQVTPSLSESLSFLLRFMDF